MRDGVNKKDAKSFRPFPFLLFLFHKKVTFDLSDAKQLARPTLSAFNLKFSQTHLMSAILKSPNPLELGIALRRDMA